MNIFENFNLCEYSIYTIENGALILFQKNNDIENLKKLQSIVNIFVFFRKISC